MPISIENKTQLCYTEILSSKNNVEFVLEDVPLLWTIGKQKYTRFSQKSFVQARVILYIATLQNCYIVGTDKTERILVHV